LDPESTHSILEKIANKFIDLLMPLIKERLEQDELMTREELSKKILRCDPDTADKRYLSKPGFPYMQPSKRKIYSKKAVQKWIAENQIYN